MVVQTDVLIVGAGPVGLALAIELGGRGVSALVVERNERSGTAPRAKTTNVRTRTHLRRWGIADKLAEAAPFGIDYPNNMVFVTKLSGPELARFSNAFNASPARDSRYPEHAQWIPQYKLERVLLDKATSLPRVEVWYNSQFETANQDEHGVQASITNDRGETVEVRARFLVGADGARSDVRKLIGASMQGQSGLSHHYNIIFRAPGFAAAHEHGPAAIYWQMGKDGFSAVGPMDSGDLWFFMPGGAQPGISLSDNEAATMIHERTGIDLPVEILSADSWTANELIADRYSDGRIFLAGDACHLHPPAGGYGMNMGVGDAVDLGWKLAAVIKGWGGPNLLASYEVERRKVHRTVMDEAMANYAHYVAALPEEIEDESPLGEAARAQVGAHVKASKAREFETLGTVLGLCYDSALIAPDDEPVPEHENERYAPSGRPGCLAPHHWLSEEKSLYDLFGEGFTLLVLADGKSTSVESAEVQAASLGVSLTIIEQNSSALRSLYGADLVLIRPDQHVAWRGNNWDGWLAQAVGYDLEVPA